MNVSVGLKSPKNKPHGGTRPKFEEYRNLLWLQWTNGPLPFMLISGAERRSLESQRALFTNRHPSKKWIWINLRLAQGKPPLPQG